MPREGFHYGPCDSGGGGAGKLVAVVIGLVVAAAIARPVIHAAEDLLQVVVIAATGLVALGILSTVAVLVVRSRRGVRQSSVLIDYAPREAIPAPKLAALPAPVHFHFHGYPDEAVADIMRQGVTALPATEGR